MFEEWLPVALRIGRAYARRFPHSVDVDSVVMEALWRSITSGAEISLAYLQLRMQGAIRDEMRKWAAGTRSNYISPSAFVDADEMYTLAAEAEDRDAALDRERLLRAMPPAAVRLVQHIADGDSQEQIAETYGVHPVRICQVLADLKARPTRHRYLPGGHTDLRRELARFTRQELRRRVGTSTSVAEIARKLGVCKHAAYTWSLGAMPNLRSPTLKSNPLRDAVRARALEIVGAAFRRTNGDWVAASKLLAVSQMTAYRWGKLLPRDVAPFNRSGRRPDLPTSRIVEMLASGLSRYAIAKRLGVSKRTVQYRLAKVTP